MKTFFMGKIFQYFVEKYAKFRIYRNRYFDSKTDLAYVYKKKWGLINHAAAIETLAIRASNADYAFFPKYIENSYNLGLTSTDLYFNYYLYMNTKNLLPNLKNIVFFMSGYASGMSLIKMKDNYRLVSYKYFLDIPYQEEGLIDEKREKKIFKKCENFKAKVPDDYWGYQKQKFFMTGTYAGVRAKKILRENNREPDQMIWIKKLIDQIVEDKKNIFIVLSPYSKALRAKLPPKEELYRKTYDLLNNYKDIPNVQLIDLYDSNQFDDSDMGDNDHLNEKGAKKCTMIIKKYINIQ